MIAHPRVRAACRQPVRSENAVRGISAFRRRRDDDLHHLVGVSRCGTDFQAGFAKLFHCLYDTGEQLRIIAEDCGQRGYKLLIQLSDVGFLRKLSIFFLPQGRYSRHAEQCADMVDLRQSHRLPRFVQRNLYAAAFKCFQKGSERGKASIIDRRSSPIKNNRLNFILHH